MGGGILKTKLHQDSVQKIRNSSVRLILSFSSNFHLCVLTVQLYINYDSFLEMK